MQLSVRNCRSAASKCTQLIENFTNEAEELEEQLEKTKSLIFGLKRTSRDEYDYLAQIDDTLSREINALLTRVDSFEREKVSSKSPRRKTVPKVDKSRPEAIQKLQDFQARHGPTGGWNAVDHSAFQKMWSKQADKENDIWDEEKFIEAVEADLPGKGQQLYFNYV